MDPELIVTYALGKHVLISLNSESNREVGYSLRMELENADWCIPVCLPSSVATMPGCTAFTVTPVPVTHTHTNAHIQHCLKIYISNGQLQTRT